LAQQRTNPSRGQTLLVYLAVALLTIAALAVYIHHFEGRPYRQDEAWRVHGYLSRNISQTVVWVAGNIHPPAWAILSDVWIDLAGQMESMARFLSVLLTALSLALTYRLAADLFTREIGLLAVFLTATSAFFEFYAMEFRPYSALATATLALQLTFLRWLIRPNFRHALLFVGSGIIAIYVHFFAFYAVAALLLFYLLFARWNARFYLQTVGLFAAIGLSYIGWILPFLHAVLVSVPGGINYALPSEWWAIRQLYPRLTFRPQLLSEFLIFTAAIAPVGYTFRLRGRALPKPADRLRFNPEWRKIYPLFMTLIILALAFGVNYYFPNLTKRSFIIVYPTAAIFMAYALGLLPRPAQLVLALLILSPALDFLDFEFTGQHAEVAQFMADDYEAGDPVIVNLPTLSRQVAVLYYVQERMPVKVDTTIILQALAPRQPYLNFTPTPLRHPVYNRGDESLDELRAVMGEAETVWYIDRADGTYFSERFIETIEEDYVALKEKSWEGDYRVVQYNRIDDDSD
jgi:hypothetical protein